MELHGSQAVKERVRDILPIDPVWSNDYYDGSFDIPIGFDELVKDSVNKEVTIIGHLDRYRINQLLILGNNSTVAEARKLHHSVIPETNRSSSWS